MAAARGKFVFLMSSRETCSWMRDEPVVGYRAARILSPIQGTCIHMSISSSPGTGRLDPLMAQLKEPAQHVEATDPDNMTRQ
jgi:hypothetical protein